MAGAITEAQFIFYGMRKEGWPHMNVDNITEILENPRKLDDYDNEPFTADFFKYYDWYWRDNAKPPWN